MIDWEWIVKPFRVLTRQVTVLVIPHFSLPVMRLRLTVNFLLFGLAAWSGLTVWAGYLVGRNLDYWITKADNRLMRVKMTYLAREIDKAQRDLGKALDTDRQMRVLLAMRSRRAIIEAEDGVGGPGPGDRGLVQKILRDPVGISPVTIRESLAALRRESQQRLASFQEVAIYIGERRSFYRLTPMGWPAEGRITSSFGHRFSPINRADDAESSEFHPGIDISNTPNTPILATADGVVRHAGWSGGYGRMVLLEHRCDRCTPYSTLYGHTSKVLVREGDSVKRGQMIAYMGTSGRSTGHHLHYEVWERGRPNNPMKYLKPRVDDEIYKIR